MKAFDFLKSCALCFGLACVSGCGLFWEDPYVDVTATPLNWIEIHYYNATREPIRRVNVRITGSGRVEVKSGTARRVSDSFAKDIAGDTVENYRERVFNVDADHIREVFQDLVNGGLFDKDKPFKKTKRPSNGRFVAVRAAFDNKTYSEPSNIFETDPELAERIYNVVMEFNRPVLGRKRK
ncbi:MAG: hypothetical protein J6R18_03985 [Kiritimatiellae bacterium]|nr:hypothetical protein [Kiritimatiellia bacterium]